MITILAGANWYALKTELDKAVSLFRKTHGDLAIEKIYGPDAELNTILGSVGSMSLFSEDRMVVITDLSGSKAAAPEIERILAATDESIHLVLVETSLDKRSSYYKTLKKQKHFREFSELSEDSLAKWAVDFVNKSTGTLSLTDGRYLVERIGASQTRLERELSKLVLYDKNITRKTIDDLTEAVPASTVFHLVESAFGGNIKHALKLYEEQRRLRKEPQAIYGMLVWQMHLVAVCAAAGNKGAQEISTETGLNSFTLGKAQNIARRMGPTKVKEFLELLRDIEFTSKKQSFDLDEALKYAIMKLAN